MSILDLSHRLTHNPALFDRFKRSSDSLVFIDHEVSLEDGPGSVELTIGASWYNCRDGRYYAIPSDGLRLRPRDSVVVETRETVAVPLNVVGLLTGKGKYNYQSVIVSTGKVDPGYHDRLRIGLYNAGKEVAILKSAEPFCSCVFLQLESEALAARRLVAAGPRQLEPRRGRRESIAAYIKQHWFNIATIIIAVASLIVAILWHH